MPLNDQYPKTVAFVIGVRPVRGTSAEAPTPIGTAFFVSVPAPSVLDDAHPGAALTYAVTARHVVDCENATWLRINRVDGGWDDVRVPGWVRHPSADVSIAPIDRLLVHDTISVRENMFSDRLSVRPALGDPVYFVGLLESSDLADANVPIVRSGTVGAIYRPHIALKNCDDVVHRQEAHIIDCRSYAGFSGSPCFVEFRVPKQDSRRKQTGGITIGGRSIVPEVHCFGVISAHWDRMGSGKTPSGETVEFPINTGVGIVTPIERVSELLMDEDVQAERNAQAEAIVQYLKDQDANALPTSDSAG